MLGEPGQSAVKDRGEVAGEGGGLPNSRSDLGQVISLSHLSDGTGACLPGLGVKSLRYGEMQTIGWQNVTSLAGVTGPCGCRQDGGLEGVRVSVRPVCP